MTPAFPAARFVAGFRFQAPGEQVEIVKSESQPHLNGLQGYVDFSHLKQVSLEGEQPSNHEVRLKQASMVKDHLEISIRYPRDEISFRYPAE